jgi:hypothetical protein
MSKLRNKRINATNLLLERVEAVQMGSFFYFKIYVVRCTGITDIRSYGPQKTASELIDLPEYEAN